MLIDVHQLIQISTVTQYVPQQSDSKANRFVFAYTITIKNNSAETVQLLSRRWLIEDAHQKIDEVIGEGVIGQQPIIHPGDEFTYSSGAVLETEMGTMQGHYVFTIINTEQNEDDSEKADTKSEFSVPIEKFILTVPRTLH